MNTNALFPLYATAGLLVLAACGGPEAPPAEVDEPPVVSPSEAVLSGAGPWTATSSGGSDVTVRVDDTPLLVGPVRVVLSIERGPAAQVVSVDLLSPTMPMHGVVRVPVSEDEDGPWAAELDIPMEGLWALYVNLDEDGADAAEFRFEVAPPSQGTSDSAAGAAHASRREAQPGHARHE